MKKPVKKPARKRTLPVLCALLATTAALSPAEAASASTPSLAFGPCPDGVPAPAAPARVECGTLTVPLDRSRPDGPTLRMAVSRVRATGTPAERRGVLLVNPGGPGGAGLAYAVVKRAKLPERVRRAYDVVGFDPRGVGRSAPVGCGGAGGLFRSPAPDPVARTRPAERTLADGLRRLADDCATGAGAALPHLSTEATARDMDDLRAALGEPRIGFLGVSYGSYLGAAYAALFPRHTGRMVLDSVVAPVPWYDFDLTQAEAMLRQRTTLLDWLGRHGRRFGLGDTGRAVRASYDRARARLAARPVRGFGPAEFDRVVYRALGRTERWAPLGDGLRAYLRTGSVSGLRPAAPFDSPGSRNYEAANRVVKCADGPGPDPGRVTADARRLRRLDPLPVLTGIEASACAYWHHRPARRTRLGGPSVPPVLLVASDHDPVTPLAGARRMAAALPGSRLVTLANDYSHGVFASRGNACVDDAVAAYLVDGAVPGADVRCAGAGLPAA